MSKDRSSFLASKHAWRDMLDSTAYRRQHKDQAELILAHPAVAYIKLSALFNCYYNYFMTRDPEIAKLPYNKAVIKSRHLALSTILYSLNRITIV